MSRWLALSVVALTLLAPGPVAGQNPGQAARIDAAFRRFWAASTPAEATRAAVAVTNSGVSYEEALRRLKAGRTYEPQKPGIVELEYTAENGLVQPYTVSIPDGYDPQRRYPVRVQLHGGIRPRSAGAPDKLAELKAVYGREQIYVLPSAFDDVPWWSEAQVNNLRTILDRLKRTYNVDENRVVLSGVSDGGTGALYVGMRDTTPFASLLPLNGFLMVLANQGIVLNETLFPNNLRNKPIFAINGGKDPLYPADTVAQTIDQMKRSGVTVDFRPQPNAGHDTSWWPELKDAFETFAADHPREPNPTRLTWQVFEKDVFRRAHWLVIDKLSPPDDDADANDAMPDTGRFSVTNGRSAPGPLFAYQPPAGRADAVVKDNKVTVTTEGVEDITLLMSPDWFDFAKPVTVVVNDVVVFDMVMEPNTPTLMRWAARDNDRTMLFPAELHVHIEETK